MIILNQISKRYPSGFEALKQINLSLGQEEMVFLTGNSGSGKTTLLKLIGMLEQPTTGQITVKGLRLQEMKKAQVAQYRSSLGIAPQIPNLIREQTVFDNVALPLQIQGLTSGLIKKQVRAALDKTGLSLRENIAAGMLSVGDQQRVGVARAIVHRPAFLLVDEPTANLDAGLSQDMMQLFEQLNQSGMGILIATHDLALIARMKYRMVMLKGGRVC